MTMPDAAATRNTREDVIRAAGRLFAERGYHGTSMRDLGRELGLNGSSLYSHIESKESLLVDVVARGAALFEASASAALTVEGSAADRIAALVRGHIDVVLDHIDEARTFLNEARVLEEAQRDPVVSARDRYEAAFRLVLAQGRVDGSFSGSIDPKLSTIFILSILNAVDRWYQDTGPLGRDELCDEIVAFCVAGIAGPETRNQRAGRHP
jgi:AcrR family transcriptional regulator